jgi:hypothetical protein
VLTALAAYVVDCSGITTPEEAMQCCQALSCSSSGHSQECCEAMPQMRAPFTQPDSADGISFAPAAVAVLSLPPDTLKSDSGSSQGTRSLLKLPGASPPGSAPIRI